MAVSGTRRDVEVRAGEVSGQLVVGDHNLVVLAEPGALVTVVEGDSPTPTRLARPLRTLPRSFPQLIDRVEEAKETGAALTSAIPVELCGEAGIGKSVLFRELVNRLAGSQPGGAVHASVRGLPLEDALDVVFELMYDPVSVGGTRLKPTRPELERLLAEERVLVALDDITLDREDVEALVNVAATCAFLLVSEERRLWNEGRSLKLAGLPEDAALLLLDGALDRHLTPEELPAARALWAILQGHPLHLLQAASAVRDGRSTLQEVVAETLGGLATQAVERSEVQSLTGPERDALAVVAAAQGAPVPTETVQEVTAQEDAEAVLLDLERKGLVTSASPYRSAIEPETATGELDVERWGNLLAGHLIEWAERHRDDLDASIERLDLLRWALDWAAERERWDDILRLVRAEDGALSLRSRWGTWGWFLDRGLHAARSLHDRKAEGWALHQIGTRALCTEEHQLAQSALSQALEVRQAIGDRRGEEVTRHNLELLRGPPPPPGGDDGKEPGPPTPHRPPLRAAALAGTVLAVVASAVIVGKQLMTHHPSQPPRTPPALTASTLAFGREPLGERTGPRTERVTNRGPGTLSVETVSIAGPSPSDFVLENDGCSRASLSPGEGCSVAVVFAPTSPGLRSATLEIPSNGGLLLAPTIHGTGISANVVTDITALDFGAVEVATTSAAHTVIVRNHGTAPATVRSVTLTGADRGDFRIEWTSCVNKRLVPHGNCRLHMTFAPQRIGSRTASLSINHAALGSAYPVPLTGVGRSPPPGSAVLRVTPAALTFGDRPVNTSTDGIISVTNPGSKAIGVAVSISPAIGPFAINDQTTTCRAAGLGPRATCHIGVSFSPATPGSAQAFVTVRGAGSGVGEAVMLDGNGVVSVVTFPVTVTVGGGGTGSVTSAPAGIACPGRCVVRFARGAEVTLSAASGTDSSFDGWGGSCAKAEGAMCSLVVDVAQTATAVFSAFPQHTLTVTNDGSGTVTSAPGGITCTSTCSASFVEGTSVTLTAVPDEGWYFDSWSGDCSGDGAQCTLTMSADMAATALYYQGDVDQRQAEPGSAWTRWEATWARIEERATPTG